MPFARRLAMSAATLLAAGTHAACYAYLPPAGGAPPPGTRASFSLSDSGSVVMAPRIGPSVAAIEGLLVADSAERYLVAVSSIRQRNGVERDWTGERVVVPHALVTDLAQRAFSAPRTAFAAALVAAGLTAITAAFHGRGDNGALGSGTGGRPVPQ